MPTYDYECLGCKHAFELFQMMSEKPIKKCPKCGQNKAKRLIGSGMGIIFKGSGFYETDYKRKENNSSGGRSADNNISGDKKQESKEKNPENFKKDITKDKPQAESKSDKAADAKGKDKK